MSQSQTLVPLTIIASSSPATSDPWDIENEPVIRENEVIVLNGSLLIKAGGKLTLRNVTLLMNCDFDGQYNITVYNGGFLTIEAKSVVTAYNSSNRWFLMAHAGSSILLNNSTFSYAGWESTPTMDDSGLWINTNGAQIINSTFHNNYYGLYLYQAEKSLIINNSVTNCSTGIF